MNTGTSSLPYTDTKAVGAADFYFALNATFRFIEQRLGAECLRRYWHDLGSRYYAPVTERWKTGGLQAVASYWRDFFQAEPGADVEVLTSDDAVTLQVRVCPIIKHLRDNNRAIMADFCQHCYFVSDAMAAPAGMNVHIQGGNGSCTQRFCTSPAAKQDLTAIASCGHISTSPPLTSNP